jgi:hypothetical protein
MLILRYEICFEYVFSWFYVALIGFWWWKNLGLSVCSGIATGCNTTTSLQKRICARLGLQGPASIWQDPVMKQALGIIKNDKNMKHLVFGWACAGWTSFQTGSNQLAQAIELLISSSMCQSDVSPESISFVFSLWVSYWGSPMGLLCRAFHTEVYWIWTWFIFYPDRFWWLATVPISVEVAA